MADDNIGRAFELRMHSQVTQVPADGVPPAFRVTSTTPEHTVVAGADGSAGGSAGGGAGGSAGGSAGGEDSGGKPSSPSLYGGPYGFEDSQVVEDVRFLSQPELGGRAPKSDGSARAAMLIARRFEEVGLVCFHDVASAPSTGKKDGGSAAPGSRSSSTAAAAAGGDSALPKLEGKYLHPFPLGCNVMGYLPGSERPSVFMVMTAHYDHLGVRGDGSVFTGADDNGSGVACLLAAARHFARPENRPRHSIVFLSTDCEESGFHGCWRFLGSLPPPVTLDSIALNINPDMVGRSDRCEVWLCGSRYCKALRDVADPVIAAHTKGEEAPPGSSPFAPPPPAPTLMERSPSLDGIATTVCPALHEHALIQNFDAGNDEDAIMCDECLCTFAEGDFSWSCSGCGYDVCHRCLSTIAGPEPTTPVHCRSPPAVSSADHAPAATKESLGHIFHVKYGRESEWETFSDCRPFQVNSIPWLLASCDNLDYHTPLDTFDRIDQRFLVDSVHFMVDLVAAFDKSDVSRFRASYR